MNFDNINSREPPDHMNRQSERLDRRGQIIDELFTIQLEFIPYV